MARQPLAEQDSRATIFARRFFWSWLVGSLVVVFGASGQTFGFPEYILVSHQVSITTVILSLVAMTIAPSLVPLRGSFSLSLVTRILLGAVFLVAGEIVSTFLIGPLTEDQRPSWIAAWVAAPFPIYTLLAARGATSWLRPGTHRRRGWKVTALVLSYCVTFAALVGGVTLVHLSLLRAPKSSVFFDKPPVLDPFLDAMTGLAAAWFIALLVALGTTLGSIRLRTETRDPCDTAPSQPTCLRESVGSPPARLAARLLTSRSLVGLLSIGWFCWVALAGWQAWSSAHRFYLSIYYVGASAQINPPAKVYLNGKLVALLDRGPTFAIADTSGRRVPKLDRELCCLGLPYGRYELRLTSDGYADFARVVDPSRGRYEFYLPVELRKVR